MLFPFALFVTLFAMLVAVVLAQNTHTDTASQTLITVTDGPCLVLVTHTETRVRTHARLERVVLVTSRAAAKEQPRGP